MAQERYSIFYSSRTGNTRMLADAIREALPEDACDAFGTNDTAEPLSELLYVGFWTDRGNADGDALALLARLRKKKIFLSGTAGFGSEAYYRKVLERVRQSVDESNTIVGTYMCQGKMPQAVKERYLRMKQMPEHPENLDALIRSFDCALSHPDAEDLEALKNTVRN